MTRRLVLAAAAMLAACQQADEASANQEAPANKPQVYLITSLPLLFGEQLELEFDKPAVTRALESKFALKPVDLPSQVPDGAVLLMVQPRALPPDELVTLDDWVRRGGRLALFADPMLEWPSERPLGDRLRPPPMYADTGLLGHWGLRLDAPDERGPVVAHDKEGEAMFLSPGRLVKTGGACAVSQGGLVADCEIGKGHATIIADADPFDMERIDRLAGRHVAFDTRLIELLELMESR